jgi:hypothetical protein
MFLTRSRYRILELSTTCSEDLRQDLTDAFLFGLQYRIQHRWPKQSVPRSLELAPAAGPHSLSALAVDVAPPNARFVIRSEGANYARMADRISIRHPDGDVVAVIEIVSPGTKDSRHAIRAFARKAVGFLQAGIHLLIVDLFPPNRRNPPGIQKVIWDRLCDEAFELPSDKPLTLAAYAASSEIVAYIEPVAVSDILQDRPIFLTPEYYVNCPLEATYQATWSVFPAVLKPSLERPVAAPESG